jgi:hypothetical protein
MKFSIGARGENVQKLQKALQAKGFDPGPIDGIFGSKTRMAVISYQMSVGLEPSGVVDLEVASKLGMKLGQPPLPKTREEFRQLMLGNPNYFGNLEDAPFKAVAAQAGNTSFEELVGLGYQPQLDRLVAIVHVKQMFGYSGTLCDAGSYQNVRFFVDWNNDGNWTDLGVARFNSHDIPEDDSLHYAISIPLNPELRRCDMPMLPRVRAILSWNDTPPAGRHDYLPPWGNALDTHIQIQALPEFIFEMIPSLADELVGKINMEIIETMQKYGLIFGDELMNGQSLMLSPEQLIAYKEAKIPPIRYAAGYLAHLAKIKSAAEIAELAPMIQQQLGFNIGALFDQWHNPGQGNRSYEELTSVGYDRDRRMLSAIVHLKQPLGYGGDLCSLGSPEYVSFWVWDETMMAWSRLGISSVRVHDIPIPADGLDYEVCLPVDFSRYQKPCHEGFTALRVRAILSWNTPATDPNRFPFWGGRADVTIEVKPGPAIPVGTQMPFFTSVGDMAVCDINPATGLANGPGMFTAGMVQDAPFGGSITISGYFSNPPTSFGMAKPKYRISVRPFDPTLPEYANPWQPLTNEFRTLVATSIGGGVVARTFMTQTPDHDGYYTYQEVIGPNEWQMVDERALGRLITANPHGVYEIKLEGKDAFGSMVSTGTITCPDGSMRQSVRVHIDNQRPHAELRITGVMRKGTNQVVAVGECDKFAVGDKLIGTYVATDKHFARANLIVRPDPRPAAQAVISAPVMRGVSRYAGGLNPFGERGSTWELDTTNMRPCGYTLTLDVVDRTIVDSSTVEHWRTAVTVGFSLDK